jgi:hypothetical protein
MSLDSLFEELDVNFRPERRAVYFEELAHVAQNYQSALSGDDVRGDVRSDDLLQSVESLIDELEGETVEFSKVLDVLPLKKTMFTDHGVEAHPQLTRLMRRFNFFLVHVPITLVPKPGWGFIQLDCILEFNPGAPAEGRPVAYQLFPTEIWETVISFTQGLEVGLDENFEFKTPHVDLPGVSEVVKGQVALSAAGQARLVVGPFNPNIKRPKIISRGRGNVKVRWRLEGEKQVSQEEPRLAIVMQVPKDVVQVDVAGALKASKRFHPFTAHVRHLLGYVKDSTRDFFEQGAPQAKPGAWTDITANL